MGNNQPSCRYTIRALLIAGFIFSVGVQASTNFTTVSAGTSEYGNFSPAAANLFRDVTQISRVDAIQGISSAVTFTSSDESASVDSNGAPFNAPPSDDLLFLYNGLAGLSSPVPVAALGFNNGLTTDPLLEMNGLRTDPLWALQTGNNLNVLSYLGLNQSGIGAISLPQLYSDSLGFGGCLPGIICSGVPEPATWLFMAGGLGGLALLSRRPGLFSSNKN